MFSLIAVYFAHRRMVAEAAAPAATAQAPARAAANEQRAPVALPLAA